MRKLTAKQTAAADYFVIHSGESGAKTAAYRHAYSTDNMKKATANRSATTLFQKPHVAAYVAERQAGALEKAAAMSEHVEINAAWVLKRAALLANFNIRKFLTTNDTGDAVYDFSGATDDDWYCIDEYTVETLTKGSGGDKYDVERVKIKGVSKLRALELVGKHIEVQAFSDKVEHSGTITTENYDLSDTERSARIAALLERARTRRDGSTDT